MANQKYISLENEKQEIIAELQKREAEQQQVVPSSAHQPSDAQVQKTIDDQTSRVSVAGAAISQAEVIPACLGAVCCAVLRHLMA